MTSASANWLCLVLIGLETAITSIVGDVFSFIVLIMQSHWLNQLRVAKRGLAYGGHDLWRAIANRNQLTQTVNQTEIRFIGLRRSGNHAILSWIMKQLPQKPYFLNNVAAGMSPLRFYHWHFPDKGYRGEAWGNFSKKDCLIHSYEDYSLREISNRYSHLRHDFWVGKTARSYDVLVLRDPFNLLASRLKKQYMDVKTPGASVVSLWLEHAKEYVGESSILRNTKVTINYNAWCKSLEYRQEISKNLNLTFSDAGFGYVSSYGGGSSFDGQSFQGDANKMDIENRWRAFQADEAFCTLVQNDELLHYSNLIFGEIPGTAQFRC